MASDFVTPERRDRFALLARLSMPQAVQQRIASDRASWAALTAGTHEPEPDASEMVRNRSIVDEDADRLYVSWALVPATISWTSFEGRARSVELGIHGRGRRASRRCLPSISYSSR